MHIVKNWSNDIIIEVKQQSDSESCPDNTELAGEFTFPGIVSGCDCSKSYFSQVSIAD